MATELNRCPECGTQLDAELVRCTTCLAFVHDANPWQREHKLIAFPVSLIITTILAVLITRGMLPGLKDIFGDGISLTILGVGIYALLVIYLKNRVTTRQVKAFRIIRRLLAPGTQLTEDTMGEARDAITLSRLMPFNTLLAYNRLQWVVEAAAKDVAERELLLRSMHEHSDTDWESLDSTFSFVQYLVWLLPSLGFLGTVWGMTEALSGFSSTVNQTAGDLSFQNSLSETARGLGVAFHTTLVGLAFVIPVLLAATAARRRVQHLLEQLDRFFIRYCSQPLDIKSPSPDPETPTTPDDYSYPVEAEQMIFDSKEEGLEFTEISDENEEDISEETGIVVAELTPPVMDKTESAEEPESSPLRRETDDAQSDLGDADK